MKVALLGAGAGAGAGIASITLWALLFNNVDFSGLLTAWLIVGTLGAALGMILLPLSGFTALRSIPIWKILLTTFLATAIGGVIGAQFFISSWLLWPIGGFLLAVAGLWLRGRTRA